MPVEHPNSDLLPAYALGILDENESKLLTAHLSDCEACQADMAGYQHVVAQLPLAVAEADPPADLKQRLMNSVVGKSETAVSPSAGTLPHTNWLARLQSWLFWKPAVVFVIVLLVLGNVLLWRQVNQLNTPPEGMIAIAMTSTDAAPAASGFFLVSVDGLSGAIIADDLPQLPAEQQYQLWLYRADEVEVGAAFTVDALGYGGKWVNAPQSLHLYTHFNVTIEPVDGGGKRPSGEIVLTGTFDAK